VPSVPEGRADEVIVSDVAAMVIDIAVERVWTGLLLSLTLAVKVNVPFAVGVPEISPLPAVSVKPVGRLPMVIDQVYVGVPPVACSVCEYAVPSVPEASVDEVIVSCVDPMVIDVATDLVCAGLLLSLTVTVKLELPFAVGVPEITPLPAASVSPVGRLPAVTDQVYPGVPPLACSVCEYAVPSVPEANVDEVIVSCVAPMVIDVAADLVCAGLLLSLTVTVKLDVPFAVGVPEIAPLPAARVSPAGRLPEVTDQVYPGVPPLACSACE
jgi:ABC-type thiamin/hydroxymethylpyrimidine transport system permease subunit